MFGEKKETTSLCTDNGWSNKESSFITCKRKYIALSNIKKTTPELKLKVAVRQSLDNYITHSLSLFLFFSGGCPNLEDEIANAIVNTTKTFEVGQVPFRTGDTISIYCNKGAHNKFQRELILTLYDSTSHRS